MKKNKILPKNLREIQIIKSTSSNGKRRYLQMTEMIKRDGYLAQAQKKYSYFVSEKRGDFLKGMSLKKWMETKHKDLEKKPKHVSIKRVFNHETGLGQSSCRTSGSFYIVQKKKVFAIAYVHTVRFDIIGPSH